MLSGEQGPLKSKLCPWFAIGSVLGPDGISEN